MARKKNRKHIKLLKKSERRPPPQEPMLLAWWMLVNSMRQWIKENPGNAK